MSYDLKKNYVDRKYQDFKKDLGDNIPEDLAFTYFTLGTLFKELDPYNIDDEIITDGGEDKQIDVVYIEKNTINILQVKKSNKNYSSTVVIQIGNGLDRFFKEEQYIRENLNNIKLKNKILDSRAEESGLSRNEDMKINVYYCNFTDSQNIAKETKDEIKNLELRFKSIYKGFNFKIIGIEEYYKLIKTDEKIEINTKIEYLSNTSKIEYDIDGNTKGLVVTIPTKEIALLVEKYQEKLFDKNIRYSLGMNPVNKKIFSTAINNEESKFFWYYNNGITIICKSFSLTNNPSYKWIEIKDLQIVNGCQTSTTLYSAYKEGSLKEDSFVLLKIFSSEDPKFIDKITEATNSQTSINTRDLAANNETQRNIEDNLLQLGYYYERKRNQYKNEKINKNKKINNERLGQAVMSIILTKSSKARSNKNSIFSEEEKDKIFNRETNQLLGSYLIFKYVEDKRKNIIQKGDEIRNQIIIYGTFHISRILAELISNDMGISKNDNLFFNQVVKKIEENEDYLLNYYNKSITILEEIIKEINDNSETEEKIYSFTNFFKKNSTDERINKFLKSLKIKEK